MNTEPVSWRIYLHEWIATYAAFEQDGQTPIERVRAYFAEHFDGRVRQADVRYGEDNATFGEPAAILYLRLPNLRGEWKTRELAEEFAQQFFTDGETAVVVGTDSREEQDLKSYGVKMLPEHENQPVALHDRISVEPDAADAVGDDR